MDNEEPIVVINGGDYEDDPELMAGMAECTVNRKIEGDDRDHIIIWRNHRFVDGVCVQCGRKLQ